MPEPTEGRNPMGTTRSDVGLPRDNTLMQVLSDPARFAGDRRKDPWMQAAPNMPTMKRFIEDHAEGDFFTPMHPPTHEDINNVTHPTGAAEAEMTMADFYRGAPKSALLWWRIQVMNQVGADPGDAIMQSFLSKSAPSQRVLAGLPPA